jgi:hypothetical protein
MLIFGMTFPPRPRRNWSPSYVSHRLARAAWETTHPGRPWLTRDAVRFLERWLKASDLLVEFGSGRSTRWFAERVRRQISIESDPHWHRKVQVMLSDAQRTNVELLLEGGDASAYVGRVDVALGSDRADAILVDGVHRDHAALWAVDHLRPDGLLMIDNANWFFPSTSKGPASIAPSGEPLNQVWAQVWKRLASWRLVWMNDGISETLFCFPHERAGG